MPTTALGLDFRLIRGLIERGIGEEDLYGAMEGKAEGKVEEGEEGESAEESEIHASPTHASPTHVRL